MEIQERERIPSTIVKKGESGHYSDYNALWWKTDIIQEPHLKHHFYFFETKETFEDKKYSKVKKWGERKEDLVVELDLNSFSVPFELIHIKLAIEDSKEILEYQEDWDGEGSAPVKFTTYESSVSFLINYAKHIFYNSHLIIKAPYIDCLRDGAIYLQWETEKGKLLIIFKEGKEVAFFYGEIKEKAIPFKSGIPINGELQEYVASWMKDYLS